MRHVYLGDESLGASPSDTDRRLAIFRREKSARLRRLVEEIVARGYPITTANTAADKVRRQANEAANAAIRKLGVKSLVMQQKLHLKSLGFEMEDCLGQYPSKTPTAKPLPAPETYRVVGGGKEQYFPTAALIHQGQWRRNAEITTRRREAQRKFRKDRYAWDASQRQNTILDQLGEFDEEGLGLNIGKSLKKAASSVKSAAKTVDKAAGKVVPKAVKQVAQKAGKTVEKAGSAVAKAAAAIDPTVWAKKEAGKVVDKIKNLLLELVLGNVKEQMAMLEDYEKKVMAKSGLKGFDEEEMGALIPLEDIKKLILQFFKKKDSFIQREVLLTTLKALPAAFPNPMGAVFAILGQLAGLVQNLAAEAGKFVATQVAMKKAGAVKGLSKAMNVAKEIQQKGAAGFAQSKTAQAKGFVETKAKQSATKVVNAPQKLASKAMSSVKAAPGKAVTVGKAAVAQKVKAAASPKPAAPAPVAKPAAPAPAPKKETVIQTVPKTVVAVQKDEAKVVGPSGGTLPQAATASYEVADATFAPQPGKVEVKK